MKDNRIKLVVFNEHTLGYIIPSIPDSLSVLQESILKGAPSSTTLRSNLQINPNDEIRIASKEDFEDFNVHFGSFGNKDEYIFND